MLSAGLPVLGCACRTEVFPPQAGERLVILSLSEQPETYHLKASKHELSADHRFAFGHYKPVIGTTKSCRGITSVKAVRNFY